MSLRSDSLIRRREGGQTLIIAMIVLGVLLVLGIVFLGILNRGIQGATRSRSRSVANDLAEAGIRYAHGQLVNSELGADWRGTPTSPVDFTAGSNVSRDPDLYYIRPAAGSGVNFKGNQRDLGGPDGLGPYVRVNFAGGRALIRVLYSESDANIASSSPTGALRYPGSARRHLVIQSIGRPGAIKTNDPTTILASNPVQYKGFTATAELQAALGDMSKNDSQFPHSRLLVAFPQIGIIDYARFITNQQHLSRAAELGIPDGLGVKYGNGNVEDSLTMQLGTSVRANGSNPQIPAVGGSIRVNADLVIHGHVETLVNPYLGEHLEVSGAISGSNNSRLTIDQAILDQITTPALTLSGDPTATNSFDSRSNNYTTDGGTLLDGVNRIDAGGYARGVGRQEPPSILTVDPETHQSRYLSMTRESGILLSGTNSGRFGHGRGVYVDNTADRQEGTGENSRSNRDPKDSLINDWLNPGNGSRDSGWQGPFYTPKASIVQYLPDGFIVERDDQFWLAPNGNRTNFSRMRYRVGLVHRDSSSAGQLFILDTLTVPSGKSIDGPLTESDFLAGLPFNGVLYFEGNVRVRGVIPTDVQLQVVSGATVYIDGSILKGIVGNDVTSHYNAADNGLNSTAYNDLLTRPSRSNLMLIAKDHVAINTTQFFGVTAGQTLEPVNDQTSATAVNPIRIHAGGGTNNGRVELVTELGLDSADLANQVSGFNAYNPSTWQPYNLEYKASNSGIAVPTYLLISHAMDNGGAEASFISLGVNEGSTTKNGIYTNLPDSTFLFPGNNSQSFAGVVRDYLAGFTNTATSYLATGTKYLPTYGLGSEPWQIYGKFESRGFVLVDPTTSTYTNGVITSTSTAADPGRSYKLYSHTGNYFTFRPYQAINGVATNDYLMGRASLAPHDIRIEASLYAEQGSFFVIPGPWFNPNPSDTRGNYENLSGTNIEKDQIRLEQFGNGPEVPFYGEPVDVKVTILGAVSENMPPPISTQAEWLRKWGWIPPVIGALRDSSDREVGIPSQHLPATGTYTAGQIVPNLVIQYDPVLATGRISGFDVSSDPTTLVRVDDYGRALPPMPRLPVSPQLAYFGDVQ